ncbi:CopG family transcriptional regulator [Archaeoglobales archaeon]|nr:MAG: CopG family transcriptional regulator [Archaeoglobales archaeon]
MALKTRRLSVAVDPSTYRILEELVEREQKSISEIVRRSINILSRMSKNGDLKAFEDALIYSELLSGEEHVIVDIEIWSAILEMIDEKKREEFFKVVKNVGYEHGIQFRKRGFHSIEEVLGYLEHENWFRLKLDSKKTYILVLSVKNEQRILEEFLKGVFEAMEFNAEIKEYYRKIIIIEN